MGAAADQPIGAQQLARHRRRQIPLAQVHPVGLHSQGNINAVIHQKQGAMGGAELAQGPGLAEFLQVIETGGLLGAVLHQAYPGPQGGGHHPLQVWHWRGN